MKYRAEIIYPSLCLPTHIMEASVKILEIYPKSGEIMSFYPQFSCICRLHYSTSDYVQQNCHVLFTELDGK